LPTAKKTRTVTSSAVPWGALLRLGRISNLPTVWTNVLVGAVLSDFDIEHGVSIHIVLAAMSSFYVGGMYLNDYFDRVIDERERPGRPIPSGGIGERKVLVMGVGFIALGVALQGSAGIGALLVAVALAGAIFLYDTRHKHNPFAPVVMGACRALVYLGAAVAIAGRPSPETMIAAAAIASYVAGITYAARQESLGYVGNLWPLIMLGAPAVVAMMLSQHRSSLLWIILVLHAIVTGAAVYLLARRPFLGAVPTAVSLLIAGISIADSLFLAGAGAGPLALVALSGFLATLGAQRYVAGT
jgi:4-hydroxybenzoate polyprenyltransferase